MLQKGLKSLQLRLNEFVLSFDNNESISNSAFTQARANLDYKAFIELNQKSIVDEFGEVPYGSKETFTDGTYCYALASTMYDLLNRVVIHSSLNKFNNYEVDLTIKHLSYSRDNDLLIYDRGYPSYRHLAHLCKANKKFVKH